MSKLNILPSTNSIYPPDSYGISESANIISEETGKLKEHLAKTLTFGERLSNMLEKLFELKNEYAVNNWDGYNAKAINMNSFDTAVRFALSIPSNIETPEIYVDPDGEISFEWYKNKRQVFSVSIGVGGKLSYAGLFGASKSYGVEYLYDNIPEIILKNIYRLDSGAN